MPRPSNRNEPVAAPAGLATWLGTGGSVLAAALVASRLCMAGEDATQGSGVVFVLLGLALGVWAGLAGLLGGWPTDVPRRLGPWGLMLLLLAVSAWQAHYRFGAEIMFWEWTSIVGVLALLRQPDRRSTGSLLATVLLATVGAQSVLACWQAFVELPALRARYDSGEPAFREQMRQMGIEPGTQTEFSFVDRLHSKEPFGTFGLPNTLAGLLVLGLPIVVEWVRLGPTRRSLLPRALVLALVVTVLLLTKSRAGMAAGAVAAGWQLGPSWRGLEQGRRWVWPTVLTIAGLTLMIVLLTAMGMLDRFIATEATKSLNYRLEYWMGSAKVLADRPWFGVGWGNFRDAYLLHKLPFASEEIADPHHFLIELACVGGVGLATVYLIALLLEWRRLSVAPAAENTARTDREGLMTLAPPMLGVLATLAASRDFLPGLDQFFAGHWQGAGIGDVWAAGAFCLLMLVARPSCWIDAAGLRRAFVAGSVGLHLHWLTTGGIGYPNLLLAAWVGMLALPTAGPAALVDHRWRGPAVGGVVVALLAVGLFARRFLAETPRDPTGVAGRITSTRNDRTDDRLLANARQWPTQQERWSQLAQWRASRFTSAKPEEAAESYRRAVDAYAAAIDCNPRRSAVYEFRGELFVTGHDRGVDPDGLTKAIDDYRTVVQQYPNSARRRALLGKVLLRAGRTAEAIGEFKRALELDETPHLDKKLTPPDRALARQTVGEEKRP